MLPPSRILKLIAVIGVVAVLGVVILLRQDAEGTEEVSASSIVQGVAPGASGALTGDIAIPVSGEAAFRGPLVIFVHASGQAEAWQRTVITPLVGGRIVAVPARESARVAANQPLVVLDPVDFEIRVSEAESQLRNAMATFQELTLFDDRIVDAAARAEREAFLRSRSGVESAELALQRARIELDRTRVTAPIGGLIASLKVVPGEWVTSGTELMTIVDLDPIHVQVQVLEGEVGYLSQGGAARVSFAALPGEEFVGRIASINPLVEPGTRTARVTVLVPNSDGRILPGMFARVALAAREFPDRVLVPRAAVLERDRRKMLFVVETDDKGSWARWRYVTTGLDNGTHIEIVPDVGTDSVRPGDVVLIDGHHTLVPDARVTLVETAGTAATSN